MKRTSETKTLMREKLDMKRVLFFEPSFSSSLEYFICIVYGA